MGKEVEDDSLTGGGRCLEETRPLIENDPLQHGLHDLLLVLVRSLAGVGAVRLPHVFCPLLVLHMQEVAAGILCPDFYFGPAVKGLVDD